MIGFVFRPNCFFLLAVLFIVGPQHRVRLIVEVVDQLDLSQFKVGEERVGRPAYPPNIIVSLLFLHIGLHVVVVLCPGWKVDIAGHSLVIIQGFRHALVVIAKGRGRGETHLETVLLGRGVKTVEGQAPFAVQVEFSLFVEIFPVIGTEIVMGHALLGVAEILHAAADTPVNVEKADPEGTPHPGLGETVPVSRGAVHTRPGAELFVVILLELDGFQGCALLVVDAPEP